MQYKNNDRKLGLSGLMRVKDDAATLAQSIDSCIDAVDELIITYHDCTDGSVQIIESKKLQYPNKIIVVPYPYHVIGVGATEEEYEYAKTLPAGHPQLLASYYNNALQYVNFKYVVKIDADQFYFTQALQELRNAIVKGVKQNKLARLCGRLINEVFCQRRGNRRIWSKYHPIHYLQYVFVPIFRKQYLEYAISELLKGNGYLSLSGVNVLRIENQWYSPVTLWPFNGIGDHLVFEADEKTEFIPWDFKPSSGRRTLVDPSMSVMIERFDYPRDKIIFLLGFFWFHLKAMKDNQFVSDLTGHMEELLSIDRFWEVSFNSLMCHLDETRSDYYYKRNFHNFVYNLDKKTIKDNIPSLDCLFVQ